MYVYFYSKSSVLKVENFFTTNKIVQKYQVHVNAHRPIGLISVHT